MSNPMNDFKPKVSIIFPIYNNAHYLKRCINSVLSQSLQDIELILVDDGSKDETPQICDDFAKTDSRITVIHKKNEGSAKARNVGIEASKGKYIAFVESDDAVKPDIYEKLYYYSESHNLEMVKCGFWYYINGNPSREYSFLFSIAKESEVFIPADKPDIFLSSPCIWAGIYKKSFIDEFNLRFIETPKASYSDYSWMISTYTYATRVSVFHDSLYLYTYDNPESSYAKAGQLYSYMFLHAYEANQVVKKSIIFNKVKEYLAMRCYSVCIHSAENVSEKDKDDCFARLQAVFKDLFDGSISYNMIGEYQQLIIRKVLEGDEPGFYEILSENELNIDSIADRKVVLFGLGACGQNLLVTLREKKINVVLLIDNNPQPELGIYHPNLINDVEFDDVIISVADKENFEKMKEQLIEYNISDKIIHWAPFKTNGGK